ncbi:MAG: UDP-glucose 4-epimerase GalE [Alphaproteobacteria bacterium]|nr:UDP-glucose 4-epimerase GalE [Alphaproteobacteria bacterium]
MNILVTGGCGYIGSHTVVELLDAGNSVVVVDNLSNSNEKSLKRVSEITGKNVVFYNVDIRDFNALDKILEQNRFDCCIHFAGLKAVGESVQKPLDYYDNNVSGTVNLLRVLDKHNCKNIIFSSSACVYGDPKKIPISEDCPKGACTNPYGQTKHFIEEILFDLYKSDSNWNIVLLRYFNPIGAHQSGKIGEDPNGVPNNLMPYITQVAIGRRSELSVFGDDYNTHDGTGVRDYIHVVDLARGHVCALKAIENKCGIEIFNLGTGHGYSVLDVVHAFEAANGVKIPYVIKPRRSGDVPICYADAGKAEKILGWHAQFNLEDMCRDSWNWQKNNPNGYGEA